MTRIHPFTVVAELPEKLEPLRTLATNLWWTWEYRARNVFSRIMNYQWPAGGLNPIEVINTLSREEIDSLAKDESFIAELESVVDAYEDYSKTRTWWTNKCKGPADSTIAYFSAEFGLHESLPVYSGGLGVLAGDYLKACSDIGVPVVGIGFLYYEGYFRQYLNADGWQQESYPQIEVIRLPIFPLTAPDGTRIRTIVKLDGKQVVIQGWQVNVGTVKLVLLDTNIEENDPQSRAISARLYGGDMHNRIRQEIVLGIGGLRLLKACGIEPNLCHMNEGHSAFLALEQIGTLMRSKNLTFEEALAGMRSSLLFTTHTPVPAGNDVFPREIIIQYFRSFAEEYGMDLNEILALGRINPTDYNEQFSMTVLALRTSRYANAVSKLHGQVSRRLWRSIWPELPVDEVPIDHVTNGAHTASWTSRDMAEVYDRYLGTAWREKTALVATWARFQQVPDEELWRILARRRSLLISFCRDRLRKQLTRRGASHAEIADSAEVLDPDALTIGFARRFAAYKRATLLFRDVDRLITLVNSTERPVQFVFAGKAHPADNAGKQLIAEIIHTARRPELRHRFLFLEDYDMRIARHLIMGVDIWMNNPRRPLEASGTSGMKASVNGALNLSVLDGWWCEAFDRQNGWSIGEGEEYEDPNYQDEVEARSLFDMLEREIVPTFYRRSTDGIPREWLSRVKHSVSTIAPQFSAARMVSDYATKFYHPLCQEHGRMVNSDYARARAAAGELRRYRAHWSTVKVTNVRSEGLQCIALGKQVSISVTAHLGPYNPSQVGVQVYYGTLDATNNIHDSAVVRLTEVRPLLEPGMFEFSGHLNADQAGSYGFSVRLVPVIEGEAVATIPALITWW